MTTALIRTPPGAVELTRPRTLAELVPPFLSWFTLVRRRMPHTIAGYGFDLARFLQFCQQAELTHPEHVTFRHVEFYLGWIQTTHQVAPRTANRHLHTLRSFWRWLVREGLATINPAAETFMLPIAHRLPTYLTVPEQETVLAALARGLTPLARRNYALVATALFTGLRCAELSHLELAHVDLDAGTLRVVQGKGRKDREVPVVPRLATILGAYFAAGRPRLRDSACSPFVFTRLREGHRVQRRKVEPARSHVGEPLLGRTIFKIVRDVVSPLVGRKIAPHTLRHSFATRLREHGADLQLIQEALGHASIVTTTQYAHLSTSRRRQQLADLLREEESAR